MFAVHVMKGSTKRNVFTFSSCGFGMNNIVILDADGFIGTSLTINLRKRGKSNNCD